MTSAHILMVDDDPLLRRSLAYSLERAGFRVDTAANAEDALAAAARSAPDLVLLDIGLPGMDGVEALARFRALFGMPVIFLTARRRELDQVLGLELGADDYVTKPFDQDVLLARIRAVLRRARPATSASPATPTPIAVGDLVLDPSAHTVTVAGRPVELANREFAVLHVLALNAGRVVSVSDLLRRAWGPEYEGETQVVYVHVRWLREKLEDDARNPRRLVTVRGVGYKLMPGSPAAKAGTQGS